MIPNDALFSCVSAFAASHPLITHHTNHPSHAFISPFLRLTRQTTGVGRRRGCGCCSRCRRWCLLVLGQFQSSAQFGDAGPHTPICFGPFHPRSSAPVGRTHSPSKTHPRLATPARLNTARYKSPTRDSAHLHFRFSLLSSGLCSRSSTRFLTLAPVATPEIIAKLRQQALQSFSTVFCCPSSRVSNSTLSLPPSLQNRPSALPFHPPPHRTARHTLAACLPPATQPRQTLRLTHTVTQDLCVRPKARTDYLLFPRLNLGWTDLLTLESFLQPCIEFLLCSSHFTSFDFSRGGFLLSG